MSNTVTKLTLLADQTQISLDERARMTALGLEPSADEEREIFRSFHTLQSGIEALQETVDASANPPTKDSKALGRLLDVYHDLVKLYIAQKPGLDAKEFELAPPPPPAAPAPKHVRFRENLVDVQEPHVSQLHAKGGSSSSRQKGGHEELFITPYRDEIDEPQGLTDQAAGLETDHEHFQLQQQVLSEQDVHLDRLAASVGRQHQLSLDIHSELDSHLELLDEVDELADGSSRRLQNAQKRLTTFSRKARNSGSLLTIAILFLIFIILLIVLK
jgi:syntaxin 8